MNHVSFFSLTLTFFVTIAAQVTMACEKTSCDPHSEDSMDTVASKVDFNQLKEASTHSPRIAQLLIILETMAQKTEDLEDQIPKDQQILTFRQLEQAIAIDYIHNSQNSVQLSTLNIPLITIIAQRLSLNLENIRMMQSIWQPDSSTCSFTYNKQFIVLNKQLMESYFALYRLARTSHHIFTLSLSQIAQIEGIPLSTDVDDPSLKEYELLFNSTVAIVKEHTQQIEKAEMEAKDLLHEFLRLLVYELAHCCPLNIAHKRFFEPPSAQGSDRSEQLQEFNPHPLLTLAVLTESDFLSALSTPSSSNAQAAHTTRLEEIWAITQSLDCCGISELQAQEFMHHQRPTDFSLLNYPLFKPLSSTKLQQLIAYQWWQSHREPFIIISSDQEGTACSTQFHYDHITQTIEQLLERLPTIPTEVAASINPKILELSE